MSQEKMEELFESDDDLWTTWEVTFIRDLENAGKDWEDLSDLQQDKVIELHDKMKENEE